MLNRNYYGVRNGNGNALRCDDGASWYNMSGNVMYNAGMEFNGMIDVWTHNNIFIHWGWTMCAGPPLVGGSSNDLFVDSPFGFTSICGPGVCEAFWTPNTRCTDAGAGCEPAIYRGDYSVSVANSTGAATTSFNWRHCGESLESWRKKTGGDLHSVELSGPDGDPSYTSAGVLARARQLLFGSGVDPLH